MLYTLHTTWTILRGTPDLRTFLLESWSNSQSIVLLYVWWLCVITCMCKCACSIRNVLSPAVSLIERVPVWGRCHWAAESRASYLIQRQRVAEQQRGPMAHAQTRGGGAQSVRARPGRKRAAKYNFKCWHDSNSGNTRGPGQWEAGAQLHCDLGDREEDQHGQWWYMRHGRGMRDNTSDPSQRLWTNRLTNMDITEAQWVSLPGQRVGGRRLMVRGWTVRGLRKFVRNK